MCGSRNYLTLLWFLLSNCLVCHCIYIFKTREILFLLSKYLMVSRIGKERFTTTSSEGFRVSHGHSIVSPLTFPFIF